MNQGTEETEIRLATTTVAAARLWKSAALASLVLSRPRTRKLLSIYWDTPDFRLRELGLALRVRRTGAGGWTQTLKAPARRVDTRCEYEAPLSAMQPDLQLARRLGWEDAADVLAIQRELQPIFRSRIVRTSHEVTFDDGTAAELALDRGDIALESLRPLARERVLEIELELMTGHAASLYELAYRLVTELPATRLLFASKSERGYRLLTGSSPPARHAFDIEIPRATKATAMLIGGRAFTESLTHVQRNVECARVATGREGVHQMRVGVRRLRVAAQIARKAGLPSTSTKLADELRWLWDLLGAGRDADVFETETWPQIERAVGDASAAMKAFDANVARRRGSAHRRIRRALDSRRFQIIMLSLGWIATLQHEAFASAPDKPGPRRLARRMLSRRAKRLERVDVDQLNDARRHRLRIDAKKLRYLAEFMAGLYAKRAARRYLQRLAALQTALGGLNDLTVMEQWVENASARLPAGHRAFVMRACSDYVAASTPVLERQFERAWRQFEKAQPFWQ